jgi:5'-nucleotidase / UDP-sugar diphosphatase
MRRTSLTLSMIIASVLLIGLASACGGGDDTEPADDVQDASSTDTTGDASADTGADVTTPDTTTVVDWDAFFDPRGWTDDGKRRVVLLHTNDLHTHLNGLGPLADFTPDEPDGDTTVGGLARVASLIERERRDPRPGAGVLAVDAGDFSFGSAFAALSLAEGLELQLLDAMGFAATTLGNHEMDWSPPLTAAVVKAGVPEGEGLKIVASNLIIPDDPSTEALKAEIGKRILPWMVIPLDNGVKVGLFGVLGEQAHKLAPHSAPITVRPLAEAADEAVEALKAEGADVIVCLSHSGVTKGVVKGEDEQLAKAVPEIDVIVGGHTHVLLEAPTIVGDTLILQAGWYGQHLGRLTLVEEGGEFVLESWDTPAADDRVPGLPEMIALIDEAEQRLSEAMFEETSYGYQTPVVTTPFDLLQTDFSESNLGDFVADAVRWTTTQHDLEGPVQVVFEANGVIRDGIHQGLTGAVRVGDLVRVLPLGIGPDQELGYPMLSFYLTASELQQAAEVIVGIAPIVADSFWLQVSGLRFEYDPSAAMLKKVKGVWLGDEVDGYADEALDTSDANTTLYRVAANLYIAEMLEVLEESTNGMIAIDMKDKDGNKYEANEDAILDIDPETPGIQELKLWRTLVDFAASFPTDEATGLPVIPERYRDSQDRVHAME